MFAVMIALAIITAVLNPLFLGGDNLRNNIRHISLISLFALGEAMVIIAGGIDLSIGSIICVTAVTTSYLAMYAGFGIGAAVAIALRHRAGRRRRAGADHRALRHPAVRGDAGLDAAAARRRRGADRRQRRRLPGQVPRLPHAGRGDRRWGCRCRSGSRSAAIAIVAFLMHRTLFGRYCYAIGSNAEAARLSGIPVRADPPAHVHRRGGAVGRRRHALRRVPADGDAVAGQRVRAARGRGGRAGRLLAAGRQGARCSAC